MSLKETPIEAARASWSMIPLKLKLPKSLYISRSVSYFFDTEFEIWACFGPAGQFRNLEFHVLFKFTLSRI